MIGAIFKFFIFCLVTHFWDTVKILGIVIGAFIGIMFLGALGEAVKPNLKPSANPKIDTSPTKIERPVESKEEADKRKKRELFTLGLLFIVFAIALIVIFRS